MGNEELWKDVLEKLSDGICASYGSVAFQMQDDVRKMEVERKTPGFNFLNFFILKVSSQLVVRQWIAHA